jgi:hypothetical protein
VTDLGRERMRAIFTSSVPWVTTSPLYGTLCATVADDDALLDLASCCRPGQQPPNLLFAAVQFLLLADPGDELAAWYPSIAGDGARAPEGAGPAFAAFCRRRRPELEPLLRERLVQTNVVGRAAALRYAMGVVGDRVEAPVALLEVGASAGVQLAFDRYAYSIGGAASGPRDAAVQVRAQWRSPRPAVLGALPVLAARAGVDLHPIDVADPVERRWLRALVWPENGAQAARLAAALDVVAEAPPRIVARDAATGVEDLAAELAGDGPLVLFHAATRAHVPADRRPAFDAALDAPGRRRRVLRIALEATRRSARRPGGPCHELVLSDSRDGTTTRLADVDGHGAWIEPVR